MCLERNTPEAISPSAQSHRGQMIQELICSSSVAFNGDAFYRSIRFTPSDLSGGTGERGDLRGDEGPRCIFIGRHRARPHIPATPPVTISRISPGAFRYSRAPSVLLDNLRGPYPSRRQFYVFALCRLRNLSPPYALFARVFWRWI